MRLREKINSVVPGEFSGRACLLALRGLWGRTFRTDWTQSKEDRLALARYFDDRASAPELHGLRDALYTIRRRILANSLLGGWTKCAVWLLIGLIAAALVSSQLSGASVFIIVIAAAGAAATLAWTWRNRPSTYEAARRLDSVAGLKDRISTAIYLGAIDDSYGMIAEQRRDALRRVAKIDTRALFPVQFPGNVRRASVLALIAAGLFAYRIHHQPPLVSLLQSTVRSQLVQSIFTPIVHAMEKDLQRTMAMVGMKPDAMGDETKRSDAASNTEDLWKADDRSAAAEEQKDPAYTDAGDQSQDQLQSPGSQEGNPSGEGRPQDSNAQSPQAKSGSENQDGKAQQSEQQGPQGRQSLGQSMMQALKNMMSNSPNQQAGSRPSQRQQSSQSSPQSGNSQQPGANESDKRGDSRGNSDAKQRASQTASEGAGSQPGTKELLKNQEAHAVNAVPDRVALEASGFKEQTRMKVATETGTAQLAVSGALPKQDAVTNGAEQENIPARYRFYVQRYFEHADNGKH
ncbi:MAG TPA: hypothetical protein VH161_10190 [Candidatus Acidoferrales bacterium]|nr:hypothetical protein [Candidatus Acidoferrales bacterium]